MGKKSKKCSVKNGRFLWYSFTVLGLGARSLVAISLCVIAIKLSPLETEARLFNTCVEERIASDNDLSEAVNFCKGGDN